MAQDPVGGKKDQEALTQDEIVVEGARSIQKPTPIGISFLEKWKQSNFKMTCIAFRKQKTRETFDWHADRIESAGFCSQTTAFAAVLDDMSIAKVDDPHYKDQ